MPFFYRDPAAPAPNRPLSPGVVALIARDGALLLECRSDARRWGLIGGAVDPHESLHEALCRLRCFAPEELVALDIVEAHRHIVDRWLTDPRPATPILE